ncbi:hypothetical protein HBH26_19290 [Sphingomonas sp. 36D10-4-7]|uniref:Transposase n=1 Tax=Sphingomonas corticis TaxID=2722791 RepID=A0ABX1CWD8_9SPHN|nr:hypothetical protein [Sphingomonas corticis]
MVARLDHRDDRGTVIAVLAMAGVPPYQCLAHDGGNDGA